MLSNHLLVIFSLAISAAAYPSIAEHLAREARTKRSNTLLSKLKKRVAFDAASQLVDVTGDHAFTPPGSGDQRGPCPGLNALANHNYLPHNGVATISQFVDATTSVFGMGADLALFLSTYGAIMDGDLTSWSIGGPTSLVSGSILGLLGGQAPGGISRSHNKYETDASPTRGDLYLYGNDFELQLPQFQELYDMGKENDTYDLDILTAFRAARFQQSIQTNPYFFIGPFSGVAVQPAAYSFIYRYMSNKSSEYPEGHLDGQVLKSFFSITGQDGDFVYTPGHERIPDNFYTRNPADPYGLVGLVLDVNVMGLQHPQFLVPGGNTGTVNSYTGLDVENLTGGVLNAGNLLENNNAICLAYELLVQSLPNLLTGVVSNVAGVLTKLTPGVDKVTDALSCPQLELVDKSQFDQFPGSTELKSDGTY